MEDDSAGGRWQARRVSRGIAVVIALVAAACAAGPASAGTLDGYGWLRFEAAPGERNALKLTWNSQLIGEVEYEGVPARFVRRR
jgi:hypothetical protein